MKRSTISKTIAISLLCALILLVPAGALAQNPEHNFINEELGVRMKVPASWVQEPGEESEEAGWFYPPDYGIAAVLLVTNDSSPLNSFAVSLSQDYQDLLTNPTIHVDEAYTLENGNAGWKTVMSGNYNGDLLMIGMYSSNRNQRYFTLLAFGKPDPYKKYQDSLHNMALSVQIDAPQVFDIPFDQALVLSGRESTNPRFYDPATTYSAGDKMAFSGLVSFDPQLNLVPDLADTWSVSPDGTVYTFRLRQNAVFHDGKPVTAQDVVYSWERAANPDTGSDTVLTYLGDIVGVNEMRSGNATHISGLEIIDEHTLQVTIDAPKPYFLLKLTYPTTFIVDKDNVESGPEWFRKPNGTGPFKLVEWRRFEAMVYQANDDFYLTPPSIPYVLIQLYSGVGIRLYESGEIDITGVPAYSLARFQDPAEPMHSEMLGGVDLCTSYVVFNTSQPPFDDAKVRQAFSMAFDKTKYIDVVMRGVGIPAKGLYPPALPGYSLDLQGLTYNPEAARKLLAESQYGSAGLPTIIFTNAGIGIDLSPSTAAMIEMWEQNLGVNIIVENLEPDRYYDEIYAGNYGQMFNTGWCADYPDPENFADVLFHSEAAQNHGYYANPELDDILEKARIEQDVTKRIELYQQAEQILVQDAPALFITHSLSHVLVKPYVKGYVLTPINIPLERYLRLENK